MSSMIEMEGEGHRAKAQRPNSDIVGGGCGMTQLESPDWI